MRSGRLKEVCAELTDRPFWGVADRFKAMQRDTLISKGERGRHGGKVMTATDRTNAFLGSLFGPPNGLSVSQYVTRLRRLPAGLAYFNLARAEFSLEDNARRAFEHVA